jgi:recombination protein RecR
MSSVDYPEPVKALIAQLKRLPGVGPKSAERIAIWMLQGGNERMKPLATMLGRAEGEVSECGVCGFFATARGCSVCDGIGRDATVLCVVEHPTDILPLERSGAFRGQYHTLRGRISPLENVGPDDLRIAELMIRIRDGEFTEVILALGSDVEGEATANYLAEMLVTGGGTGAAVVQVTRLAQGLPVGAGLENADELTLFRALEGRKRYS